jgi:lipoprotein-anchoring transpeptidase ErfK/SrfK
MSAALRVLGLVYLAAASAFAITAIFCAHPGLAPAIRLESRAAAQALRDRAWGPSLDFTRRQVAALFDRVEPPRTIAAAPPGPRLHPHAIARPAVHADAPQNTARAESPAAPAPAAPSAVPRAEPASSPASQRAAADRLRAGLSQEMLSHFDMFLYVSKADKGPLAQRLYVFQKQPDNTIKIAYDWAASTGRESHEISPLGKPSFTDTPRGYYQIDPNRMYWRYHSHAWNQPMPWTMFFNWERNGLATGLAIHGASDDDIALLGQRASAGCVHIAPENAKFLYRLIRANYRGEIPRFAYDRKSQTMSNSGELMREKDGSLAMTEGFKVLVFIEDYGGANVVAALF